MVVIIRLLRNLRYEIETPLHLKLNCDNINHFGDVIK